MEVTVIKSRRKIIAIQVNSDLSVTVRAPYGVTEKYIEEFLNKNEAWISKQMNEIKVKKKSVESGNVENVTLDKIKALAIFRKNNRSHLREYNHQKSENKMGKLQQQREFEF